MEELQDVLHQLGLDYEAEATLMYVFFERSDGRIDNFSLSLRRGRTMSDGEVAAAMRREYPSTRGCTVVGVERPDGPGHEAKWLDTLDVCRMLHVSDRSLRNWRQKGYLKAYTMDNGKVYYRRSDIDRLLTDNALQENGRMDKTAAAAGCGSRGLDAETDGKERK